MTMKKMLCMLCIFSLLLGVCVVNASETGKDEFDLLTQPDGVPVSTIARPDPGLSLDAAAVILVEKETGEVLYEKNAEAQRPIASITKVMTLILVLEAIESGKITLEDVVTVSEHAYSMGGSQIWLEPGETMTVDELMRAVAVCSANDAAVALAEFVSGSEDAFVVRMNDKAQELGMTNTTFKNANGLDEEGHLSCARDVALMSRECLRHDLVREYVTIWQDELRGGATQLTNTNKMLKSFSGITGLKTGTTSKAGVCISASAQRDGMELIAVVLGSSNSTGRFAAAKDLLEYGFANFELADTGLNPVDITPVRIKLGVEQYCEYTYDVPAYVVVERGKGGTISYDVVMDESVKAPVEEGQKVGEVTVYSEGIAIGVYPITSVRRVEKLGFGSSLSMLFQALLSM